MCLLSRVGVCCCACVHALRVIAYAFAFVCCNVASHFTHVCRLHVCFALVFLDILFVRVWLVCELLWMRLPLYVASLRFRFHVCVSCTCFFFRVLLVRLFVLVIVSAFAIVCCKILFRITRLCRLRVGFAFAFFVCLRVYVVFVSRCMRLPLFVARSPFILQFSVGCMCVLSLCMLFVRLCLYACFGVVVYVFAFVCCKLAFRATRVSIACVFCDRVFCLFVFVCMFCG